MQGIRAKDNAGSGPAMPVQCAEVSYQPNPRHGMIDPNDRITIGRWDAGLCSCCTHCVPNCCMVTFCPCVSLAQIASRLGVLSFAVTLCATLILECALWAMLGLATSRNYEKYRDELDGDDDVYYTYNEWWHRNDSDASATIFAVLWIATVVLTWSFIWYLRAKTRERFEIPGNCCGDCCATFWCTCCTMAQVASHVKSYKPGTCDFGPRDTLPAYPNGTHYISAV